MTSAMRAVSSPAVLLVVLVCCLFLGTEAQDKRYVFFGKFKWGQDNEFLYITVYCPGVSVADANVTITEAAFSLYGESTTEQGKTVDIEFSFREDVVPENATVTQWAWKAGHKPNAILVQIPKVMPHYFDRLTAEPYTKEFKKQFEIDWNRYKRNEEGGEEDLNDEEPDEEEWVDEDEVARRKHIKTLTDENMNKTLADNDLVVVHATYPWCRHCKDYNPFVEASSAKQLKNKVVFGAVDARENRKLARELAVPCSKGNDSSEWVTGCNQTVYVAKGGQWIGTYDSKNNDTDPQRMIRYLQAMSGPFPKPVTQLRDLEELKQEYEKTTVIPVGLFDSSKDVREQQLFTKYAEARRQDGRLFAIVDTSTMPGNGLAELLNEVVPDLADEVKTPAIMLIKNFREKSEDKIPHLFAGGLNPEDSWSDDAITAFIDKFKYRLLAHYGKESTDTNALMGDQTLARRNLPVAHLYLATSYQQEDTMNKVRQAALKLSRKMAFVYHDQADEDGIPASEMLASNVSELYQNALNGVGLDGAKRPLLTVAGNGAPPLNNHNKFAMPWSLNASTSVHEIVQFCEDVLASKVEKAKQSEPHPGVAEAHQVQKLVHHTFSQYVMNSSNGIFLNMYNPTSSMYKAHTPELKKLAAVLNHIGSEVKVLQYNFVKNALPEEAKGLEMIQRFTPPGTSLLFYLPGGVHGKTVFRMSSCDQGKCSAQGMLDHISEHAAANDKFDPKEAAVEVLKWDEFNPPPYPARCGIGEELCKEGYACEFSICYSEGLSLNLQEPLNDSLPTQDDAKEDL